VSLPPSGSIDRQVDDRDFQLVGIDIHAPEPPGDHRFHGDLLTEAATQQVRHAVDQSADVHRLGIERLLAREGEKALSQRHGPLRAAHGVVDGPLQS
jgi:hypothetical protein